MADITFSAFLTTYLDRIDYTGLRQPTVEVLRAIHRQHLLNISYENLDIHLRRPLTLDLPSIYDKIVLQRRGGWCYEMNSLLAWALRELGFEVILLGGSVNRARLGDLAEGNHLVLLVQLDQPWLADAGFGNGILEPLPLAEGEYAQGGFVFRLSRAGERWFFHNHQFGGVGFDFTLRAHTIDDFAQRCTWLQTSPDSGFVRVVTCQRWRDDDMHVLRGAILQHMTPNAVTERIIEDASDYRRVLHETFDLDLGEALDGLWTNVWQSHLAWASANRLAGGGT